MTETKRNPDGTRQYQAADRRIRAAIKARGEPCGICGHEIDYDLPQYDPGCFEVDHVVPISRGGQKTMANARPSHRSCNRARSNTIDADAIAAGAVPEAAAATTRGCPPGPCVRCNGTHNPKPGVTFITSRTWW